MRGIALRPLLAICGTTGVGKSNLAIELALSLNQPSKNHCWKGARIINADAMQIYTGMDVITNKVPVAERHGIEHLLMDIREPGEQYIVGEWVQDAMRVIDETHQRNQIPIIVGGTSYWIQHLIFPNRLSSNIGDTSQPATRPLSSNLEGSIASLPSELLDLFNAIPNNPPAHTDMKAALSLHQLLSHLDPAVAARWHWRDTRKVLRSLSIIKETGRRNSEIIREQAEVPLKPRYRTLCFWLYAAPDKLRPRLDSRVDEMIKNGLLEEIRALQGKSRTMASVNNGAQDTDYQSSIYQSIGFKEFHDYLNNPTEKGFEEAVENMKLSTRRYAKRQVSWLRNKLLPAIIAANALEDAPVVPTYLLNATELGDKWVTDVRDIAEKITQDFLLERDLPDPLSTSGVARTMLSVKDKPTSPLAVLDERRQMICPICTVNLDEPVMVDKAGQWEVHQKSRSHRRLARKLDSEKGVATLNVQ